MIDWSGYKINWVQISVLLLANCVALGRHYPVFQLPYLKNTDSNGTQLLSNPIHVVKHCYFMILESGYIPKIQVCPYRGGKMVPSAGKAMGEDTLCLQHDPCILAKRGLREFDMEIHCFGLFHLSTLRTKDQKTGPPGDLQTNRHLTINKYSPNN